MDYIRELRSLIGHRPLIVVVAGVLILDETGRVLLQHRYDGHWGIPGGAMELGETLEETARREVREETALELGTLTMVAVHSGPEFFDRYPNGDEVSFVIAIYETREMHGSPIADGSETRDLAFFALDALPSNMLAVAWRVLDCYLANHDMT